MEFKLVYGNHSDNPIHLMDTLMLLRFGLENAGHKADLERQMSPGKTNIIIEHFSYDFLEALKDVAASPGTDFIFVATEFLTGDTFNRFESAVPGASGHYDNECYWKKRYQTFSIACMHGRAVWHLSERQAQHYAASFKAAPTFYLPHGYAPEMERVQHKHDEYKDIDVLFTGTSTPYRDKVLNAIRGEGLKVVQTPAATNYPQREDLIARSKLAVNIRQNENWQFPSNSRFHYHVTNRSFLITERCAETCDLTPYVQEVESAKLASECKETIASGGIQGRANERHDRFRSEMPIAPLFARLLDQTYP